MASSGVVADPSEPLSQAVALPNPAHLHTPRSPTPRKSASCLLPYIDSSRGGVVQSGGASGSTSPRAPPGIVANDFLPPDLLFSLRRQGPGATGDLPPPRGGAPLPPSGRHALTQVQTKTTPTGGPGPAHPPANVWNHPARRAKLRHLTDQPPCICGAGRDISFLYDVPPDGSASRDDSNKPKSILPNSLIPEEYHMVKHPGVLGLEFHDDHYSTRSEDHDHHMTIFPSMNPAGRHEAIALKHTMEQMLLRAGVPHELRDSSLAGPTEMHNLLELVKKEQDIYNICFHELIRQVSVHCVERGELLAEIRRRYCNLLDRIPRQVKSLHDEIVAQRALDRRLTSELKRFKSRITSLTKELSEVRDHDVYVTEQSAEAQDNLASALAATEKNANLLAEYHDLYELQRKRLEDQVAHLTAERELWQQAAYDLARTVASECRLSSVQRLQLGEKAWSKLAGHFTILLSNKDTQQLSEVQGYVQQWREEVVSVVSQLVGMEARMSERLSTVEKGMRDWSEGLDDITDGGGVVQVPSREKVGELWAALRAWQAVINEEAEHFIGDALLRGQEKVKSVAKLVESWTEASLQLFSRHQPSRDHAHHPSKDPAPIQEQQTMLMLNTATDACLSEVGERLAGENGVATGFIHLITPLETWDAKLGLLLSSTDKKLPDSDWVKLQTLVKEWLEKIHDIRGYIGRVQREGGGAQDSPSLEQLVVDAEKWQSALSYSIDSQNAKIIDQVTNLHSSLVRWMVQLLLGFTGTKREEQGEEQGHASPTSPADLHGNLSALSETLTRFTTVLSRSCTDLVQQIVDLHRREGYADADEEQQELQRLREEAAEWVRLAGLLVSQLKEGRGTGEEGEGLREEEGQEEKEAPTAEETAEGMEEEEEEEEGERRGGAFPELPKKMNVLGVDDNIHPKSLQKAIEETIMSPTPSMVELGLATEEAMPEGRGPQVKDAEALLISLDETKKKLTEQEALTEQAKERAVRAEKELEDVRSQLSMAEAELRQLRASKEPSKPAKTRKTSTVSRKVSRPGLTTPQTPSRSESRRKL